jgi:hypothetical protein
MSVDHALEHVVQIPRTLIPLQFSASTCIAQKAWAARERMSVRTPDRGRRPPFFLRC